MTCKPDFSWDSFVCTVCGKALGMEDGRVPDSAITANSFWNLGYEAYQGRLHYKAPLDLRYYSSSCWSAKVNQAGEYLQVDLGREFYVTKVATQGRLGYPQWVTSYSLKYSLDGSTWIGYQQDGTAKVPVKAIMQSMVLKKMAICTFDHNSLRTQNIKWDKNNP
jgi:hypothetical protein